MATKEAYFNFAPSFSRSNYWEAVSFGYVPVFTGVLLGGRARCAGVGSDLSAGCLPNNGGSFLTASPSRRDARAVEWHGLENR